MKFNNRKLDNGKRVQIHQAYMSMTSLMRTLTATSVEGCPLRSVNCDRTVVRLIFVEEVAAQTSAMTSDISEGFNLKGCCSLNDDKMVRKRHLVLIKKEI